MKKKKSFRFYFDDDLSSGNKDFIEYLFDFLEAMAKYIKKERKKK